MRSILLLAISVLLFAGSHLATSPQAQPKAAVIRSGAQLVKVTIVVRDHKGAFVTGLKVADFAVTEDGKPVTATFFNELTGASTSPVSVTPAATPGSFSNDANSAPPSVTVILLDRLNTKWIDQARARDQLRIFLSQIRPEDRIAVYALDETALLVLHDFTSDSAALLRVVNGSATLDSVFAEETPVDVGPEVNNLMLHAAVDTTITALETIAQHLASIPGRKNLLWVSSGFPLSLGDDSGARVWSGSNRSVEIERAARELNTAQVSLYGIDPRGLVGAIQMSAVSDSFVTGGTINSNQDILEALAQRTGGRAFLNNNDLAGSVRTAVDDGEHYYDFSYYSAASSADDHYRVIKVDVKKPGVDVQYRRGYYATATEASGGDRKTALGRAIANPLEATGLPLSVTPARSAESAVRLAFSVHAAGAAIPLTQDKGQWTGDLDLVIAQIHADGTTSVDVDTTLQLRLSDAQHAVLMERGLNLTKTITLAPATSRVTVVIRDEGSGSLGSIVIPAAKLPKS